MSVRARPSLFLLPFVRSSLAASARAGAGAGLPGTDEFFLGGGFGFGDVDWVEVSPLVGYRPVPRFDFGLELTCRCSDHGWYGRDLSAGNDGFTNLSDHCIGRGLFER